MELASDLIQVVCYHHLHMATLPLCMGVGHIAMHMGVSLVWVGSLVSVFSAPGVIRGYYRACLFLFAIMASGD